MSTTRRWAARLHYGGTPSVSPGIPEVFFNDPVRSSVRGQAVRMALSMQRLLCRSLRPEQARPRARPRGAWRGLCDAGAIGFEGRWDYAAIGKVTNLAARLCSEASAGQILVDLKTMARIEMSVDAKPVGPLSLKGFSHPVPAFSIRNWRTVAPIDGDEHA